MGGRFALVLPILIGCAVDDPLEGVGFSTIAESASNPKVLYAATSGSSAVLRSDDGGGSWTIVSDWGNASAQPKNDRGSVTRLAISPSDPDVVLLGTNYEMFRTPDGGKSWSRVFDQGVTRVAFDPRHADRAFAFASGPVTSVNGGSSWAPPSASPACALGACLDFAFDATTDGRMYAACGQGGVFVSNDQGNCWSKAQGTLASADVVVPSPTEGDHLWVAGTDGVWSSIDGAGSFTQVATWSSVFAWPDVPQYSGAPQTSLTTLTTGAYTTSDAGPVLLFGTRDIGVIGVRADASLVDLGASLVRRGDAINQIVAAPSGVLLATSETCRGSAGVFASTTAGATWDSVLTSHLWPNIGPIGDAVPHVLMVIFYRDVSRARQQEIFAEHAVTPDGYLNGPLLYYVHTADNDPRSVADLLAEFQAIDDVDCTLNDFSLSAN
jgi:hypothetical protein